MSCFFVKTFSGALPYEEVLEMMRAHNAKKEPVDEFWLLEHQEVFTLGANANPDHLLGAKNSKIPIYHSDRGGEVTYHAPGQIIIYCLLNFKGLGISLKRFISNLENGVVSYLKTFNLSATTQAGAPGVYLQGKKIASIGIKVKNWRTYHGISFNYDLVLEPFSWINICGYEGLQATRLSDWVNTDNLSKNKEKTILLQKLITSIYEL